MSERGFQSERKWQGWPPVAAALIILYMLYLASFGLYVVLAKESRYHSQSPRWVTVGDTLFAPLTWLSSHAPEPLDKALREYGWFWQNLLIRES